VAACGFAVTTIKIAEVAAIEDLISLPEYTAGDNPADMLRCKHNWCAAANISSKSGAEAIDLITS
jgi:hypothetical protein